MSKRPAKEGAQVLISGASVLIVDDDVLVRTTLSAIFDDAGYQVRSAADGFSALAEIKYESPDLLLSDLNMPGMSGFELLSVVRRRFPEILVIAMSGGFSGNEVPHGVAADAFYEKGRDDVATLLEFAGRLTESGQPLPRRTPAPIWISGSPLSRSDDGSVVITCPECLRVFPQLVRNATSPTDKTHCLHCSSAVHFALVQPMGLSNYTGINLNLE